MMEATITVCSVAVTVHPTMAGMPITARRRALPITRGIRRGISGHRRRQTASHGVIATRPIAATLFRAAFRGITNRPSWSLYGFENGRVYAGVVEFLAADLAIM
jgi:hypothetical protein